ncbi:C-type lectin domain-containing protein 180 [Caenorhabditis elegans]|uniref:Isoform a of C-type lectin domain-containing protein 180 n=2 Tax=Caenorhabditis elegans TaxID=6239 RepID=Q19970-2|nr:C-type lectin domain-containing protein 180 [Caenorhabditis elegans]CCD70434.1 C-type lectin domain-containing protein 180 [Caenorhabditis elegans]|eukprot:NP_501229.2 C-type lectin domain-containing protein 180 [Caenorhabditis elegans]
MRHLIFTGFVLTLTALEAVNVAKSTDNDIVLKVSTEKHSSRDSHHFSGEWLESPWGDLYQFRAGDQNWLTAREHCLSLNADLAAIRNVEQLDWILSHYAPLSSRFAQRLVQIGLYAPEGQTHEWKWLNGNEINKTLLWSSGEPYDHSMEGRERCGLLNVEKRVLDDVDCESTSPDHHAQRYICQRTSENHKQQQRSNNYIWQKIENLFSFFGIGGSPTPHNATIPNDYEDEVLKNETSATVKSTVKFSDSEEETSSEEEESVSKTLAALPKIEGSGESTALKELQEPEGSGQIVEKKAIETTGDLVSGVDEEKLDKMINKMEEMIKSIDDLTVPPAVLERTTVSTVVLKKEEIVKQEKTDEKKVEDKKETLANELNDNKISESIEGDFDQAQSKDMPKADIEPPKEEDCDEEGSGSGSGEEDEKDESSEKIELAPEKEDKIKEFLGVLRLFLDRAEHGDLRKLLDDQSGKTLLERMKNAVREANRREFEMLEKLENSKKSEEEKEELAKKDQMSTEEQKDLYKKISSAVMKAAKIHKIEEADKVQDEQAMEKFNIAKVKADSEEAESEGTVEVLKSAKEGKAEIKEKNREKKDAKEESSSDDKKSTDEKKKEIKKIEKTNKVNHDEPKKEEKKNEEQVKETKLESSTTVAKKEDVTTVASTTEEPKSDKDSEGSGSDIEESTVSSAKPAEAEENEAELEASGHEEVSTTTESTTVAVKEVPVDEIEKIAKLEAKQHTEDEKVTVETKQETAVTPAPTTSEKTSTTAAPSTKPAEETTTTTEAPSTTTKPVTVAVKKVSPEEMEKLVKKESTEKVTLLPPLPTFTFPTLAPFTFPTLPTLATTKPSPAPKVPTLEEILGNLNDQFKKLLSPPKPLPK